MLTWVAAATETWPNRWPGALVEAAVADDDVGDAGGDRHRGLLDGRAGGAAAVVDPAEEPQLADAELAGDARSREEVSIVNVVSPSTSAGGQPAVGERVLDRLDGELQLGAPGLLGELGRADAGDRGRAAESAHHRLTVTVPVTWSPSETVPDHVDRRDPVVDRRRRCR